MNKNVLIMIALLVFIYYVYSRNKREHFTIDNPLNKLVNLKYVITLPQRKKYIQNIMDLMNIKPIYVDAYLASNLPSFKTMIDQNVINKHFMIHYYKNDYINVLNNENNYKNIMGIKGKIALHITLVNILKHFLKTNEQRCMVFEDDIEVPSDINVMFKRLSEIIDGELNFDWNIINMGRCYDKCGQNIKISNNIVSNTSAFCNHAMIYDRRAAELIVNNSFPMYDAGDTMLIHNVRNNPDIKMIAVAPAIFYQNRDNLGTTLNNFGRLSECSG